jgi:hypothetical protein
MEKSILTTLFANAVVDITIFRPLSAIDTPLPYGCSPLGSFQVGYSDVWPERIPMGCSRAQLKASIGSLPNVNSIGLRVNSQESFLMVDTVVFVYEVEFDRNANWLPDTLDLSLLSNGVDFAYGPMKSLQTSSGPVDVTRSSLTVLSLGHGDSVPLSMNATSLVSCMGALYSMNSSSFFPIPICILPMFALPSVHYHGDNLITLEDTSISLGDFFIIDSSADGGYVYNTTIITDFGILRSVLASAFPAITSMEVRELETCTKILCSETTKQSMSAVQIIGTVLGMNQLVQSLVLTPSSNYNGDVTIDFTISLYPETLSNDTYSSSFTLYVLVRWTRISG